MLFNMQSVSRKLMEVSAIQRSSPLVSKMTFVHGEVGFRGYKFKVAFQHGFSGVACA